MIKFKILFVNNKILLMLELNILMNIINKKCNFNKLILMIFLNLLKIIKINHYMKCYKMMFVNYILILNLNNITY